MVLIPGAFLFFLACGHVAHRADIEPGFNTTVLGGPAYHTYSAPLTNFWEPDRESSWATRDYQWNVGYAWQLKNRKRLLAQVILNQTRSDSDENNPLPSIDVYYQTQTGSSSRGFGLIAGLDPRFYFIWGRTFGRPGADWRTGLDFSLGLGVLGVPVTPQLMYSVRYQKVQISALAEYRYFFSSTNVGVENSVEFDDIRSRLFIGLAFSVDSYRTK